MEASPASAQGQDRDYAFHTLGWFQFEGLCRTILTDLLGQTIKNYSPANDGGVDAAFHGTWDSQKGEALSGTFTVQIKFSRRPHAPLTWGLLSKEVEKALILKDEGALDNYVVITNHSITRTAAQRIKKKFATEYGIKSVVIFGVDWLSDKITNSSHLRMLVPRVYGLGDLSEILDERAYQQARSILSWMPTLKTIVTTGAMQDAARVMREHRFVLLVGDAMVGKTTTASALAIAALDDLGLRVLKVRDAESFAQHWNASSDARQFFWIDDAFGETSYEEGLTKSWGRHLDALAAAHAAGACIVMTSRSYIWERARNAIKAYSFEPFQTSKIVIRLEDLQLIECEQMLYNHLRMGDQPLAFKEALRPSLETIASTRPFYPEAARRLASRAYTKDLKTDSYSVMRFFGRPNEMLEDVITRLSPAEKALLALIFANGGRVERLNDLEASESIAKLFGAQMHEVLEVAASATDVFVKHVVDLDGAQSYQFIHPSLSDAVASMTARRPEWLDVYVAGAGAMTIYRDTHAGRPGQQGVEIAIPPHLYRVITEKFVEITKKPGYGSFWTGYLATRSGAAYLAYVMNHAPDLLSEDHYYDREYDPKEDDYLRLCAKLAEYNALPEEMRVKAVARIGRYLDMSVSLMDYTEFSGLIQPQERALLHNAMSSNAASLLEQMRQHVDEDYQGDDPGGYYANAFEYIDEFQKKCSSDEQAVRECERARTRLERRVRELEDEEDERDAQRGSLESPSFKMSYERNRTQARDGRSIFSDIADANA